MGADTPEELLLLQAARERQAGVKAPKPEVNGSSHSHPNDPWSAFLGLASEPNAKERRRLLSFVKANGAKLIGREDVRVKLGHKSNAVVGGIASGVSKAAVKAGLGADDVLVANASGYKAGPLLRQNDLPWNGDGSMTTK